MPSRPTTHKPMRKLTQRHQVVAPSWGTGRGGRPWRRLRKQILERDRYTCCACRKISVMDMEVDHLVPVSQGGTDDPNNLRAMCRACHALKTARESGAGRAG